MRAGLALTVLLAVSAAGGAAAQTSPVPELTLEEALATARRWNPQYLSLIHI